MSATQSVQQYVDKVASALNAALCLQAYPSPKLERCSAPQIELNDRADLMGRTSKIARRDDCCLIEESINSVRVSLRLPTGDLLERELVSMYMRFLMQRAAALQIVRKVPIEDYHITFLITDQHVVTFGRETLVRFITNMILQSEGQTTDLKLAVNTRGRAVATEFLSTLTF